MEHLEQTVEGFNIQFCGGHFGTTIRPQRIQKLHQYMIEKEAIDTTKFVLSPMPGALIDVMVEEGDKVEMGQEIAVIEAMKMQNILRSERAGVVAKVVAEPGATLAVDQVVVEIGE